MNDYSSVILRMEQRITKIPEIHIQQECQHESDGHRYDTRKLMMHYSPIDVTWQQLLDMGCHNKCKKCGEFYRG